MVLKPIKTLKSLGEEISFIHNKKNDIFVFLNFFLILFLTAG